MLRKIIGFAVLTFLGATQVAAWDDSYCRENKVRCNSNANAYSSSEECNVRYLACQWSNIWIKSCDPNALPPTPPPAVATTKVQAKVKQASREVILRGCEDHYYTCDEKAGDPFDTQECNMRFSACRRSQYGTWVPMCPTAPPALVKVHHSHHHHHEEAVDIEVMTDHGNIGHCNRNELGTIAGRYESGDTFQCNDGTYNWNCKVLLGGYSCAGIAI